MLVGEEIEMNKVKKKKKWEIFYWEKVYSGVTNKFIGSFFEGKIKLVGIIKVEGKKEWRETLNQNFVV